MNQIEPIFPIREADNSQQRREEFQRERLKSRFPDVFGSPEVLDAIMSVDSAQGYQNWAANLLVDLVGRHGGGAKPEEVDAVVSAVRDYIDKKNSGADVLSAYASMRTLEDLKAMKPSQSAAGQKVDPVSLLRSKYGNEFGFSTIDALISVDPSEKHEMLGWMALQVSRELRRTGRITRPEVDEIAAVAKRFWGLRDHEALKWVSLSDPAYDTVEKLSSKVGEAEAAVREQGMVRSRRPDEDRLDSSTGCDVVYDDDNYRLVVPISHAASMAMFGVGPNNPKAITNWCTAYENKDSYWDGYVNGNTGGAPGYLLCFIDKKKVKNAKQEEQLFNQGDQSRMIQFHQHYDSRFSPEHGLGLDDREHFSFNVLPPAVRAAARSYHESHASTLRARISEEKGVDKSKIAFTEWGQNKFINAIADGLGYEASEKDGSAKDDRAMVIDLLKHTPWVDRFVKSAWHHYTHPSGDEVVDVPSSNDDVTLGQIVLLAEEDPEYHNYKEMGAFGDTQAFRSNHSRLVQSRMSGEIPATGYMRGIIQKLFATVVLNDGAWQDMVLHKAFKALPNDPVVPHRKLYNGTSVTKAQFVTAKTAEFRAAKDYKGSAAEFFKAIPKPFAKTVIDEIGHLIGMSRLNSVTKAVGIDGLISAINRAREKHRRDITWDEPEYSALTSVEKGDLPAATGSEFVVIANTNVGGVELPAGSRLTVAGREDGDYRVVLKKRAKTKPDTTSEIIAKVKSIKASDSKTKPKDIALALSIYDKSLGSARRVEVVVTPQQFFGLISRPNPKLVLMSKPVHPKAGQSKPAPQPMFRDAGDVVAWFDKNNEPEVAAAIRSASNESVAPMSFDSLAEHLQRRCMSS